MTGGGRPLRFLLLVVGGWTGTRAWWLWPETAALPAFVGAAAHASPPPALPPMRPDVPPLPPGALRPFLAARPAAASPLPRPAPAAIPAQAVRTGSSAVSVDPRQVAPAPASMLRYGDPVPGPDPVPAPERVRSRLSGSGWLLARGGPALAGGLAGAQLGGSQAGVRLAYAIDNARRLAIVGRLSTALGASGSTRFLSDREGAIGVAWRPTRLPVTLVAEQRFVFDGGHGGPTLGVIAGLPPTPVAAGFRLEAYGQAGAIARAGAGGVVEGFGDGAARLTRPVALGPLRLDLGAGAWGGAQRGAARLDIGPSLGASLPVAGHAVRLTADWRARVAGSARPGSGPALSLGTDF